MGTELNLCMQTVTTIIIDTCNRAERDWMRKDIYILRDVMDRQALSEAYFTTTAFIVRVYTYRAIATAHRNEHIIITSPKQLQQNQNQTAIYML